MCYRILLKPLTLLLIISECILPPTVAFLLLLLLLVYIYILPGRSNEEFADSKRQRLKPGTISPTRPVPNHIPKPPYVKSRKPPGIASGPEIHNEKGIACMRASGRLAAQVLQHAGTLVKVHFCSFPFCI